jgi:Tfp pilus tip-associated adhesin PilY1
LKGSIDLLPLDTIASTLLQCYQAQANIKGQIFEITGIADIIRGSTQASETATAQQIKGQYAGLRLRFMQEGVSLFASELLRIKAQIVCSKFQPQTILAYAAADQFSAEDQQLIPQALQLLENNPLRSFRIEVAEDSLVQLDEQQLKQDRVEFLTAIGNFMREALPVGQSTPELVPMLMALVKFGVTGFKQARPIEGIIDTALQQLTQKAAQNAANPQPSPEEQKIQAQQQAAQAELQAKQAAEQARMQADIQIEQMKAQFAQQLEASKQQHESNMKIQELTMQDQFEQWKAELDAKTKITVARIGANPGLDVAAMEEEEMIQNRLVEELISRVEQNANSVSALHDHVADVQSHMTDMHERMVQATQNVVQKAEDSAKIATDAARMSQEAVRMSTEAARMSTAPKRIVRGPDGRAIGVEVVKPGTVQ